MAHPDSDKVMFEIYREENYDRRYRVVYFTELSERNRDLEIGQAMAGEHLLDGYIASAHLEAVKAAIADFLDRLNAGEALALSSLAARLAAIQA